MQNFEKIVCKNIRKLRRQQKMSQEKFAEAAGISERGLRKIESVAKDGEAQKDVLLSNVVKCARALNINPAFLFLDNLTGALPFNYEFPERLLKIALAGNKNGHDGGRGEGYLYKMTLKAEWEPVRGVIQEYGIDVFRQDKDGEVLVDRVEDVTSESHIAARIVHILNLYRVEHIHLYDVLEDLLDQQLEEAGEPAPA